jgi:hypothetical protein
MKLFKIAMKKLISIIWFVALTSRVYSQNIIGDFVVLTIEETYQISMHGTETYFWIVPVDSIDSFEFELSRLFLKGFNYYNLSDCCKGVAMDPFVFDQRPYIAFENEFLTLLDNNENLIRKNRKKIVTIKQNWKSGQKVKINVFATSVEGVFCICDYDPIGQYRTGYVGKVFVPKSSFKYTSEFWSNPKSDFIIKRDYSRFDFSIIRN